MSEKHPVFHVFLLIVELSILTGLAFYPVFHVCDGGNSLVVHRISWMPHCLLTVGIASLIMAVMSWFGSLRIDDRIAARRMRTVIPTVLGLCGLLLVIVGGRQTWTEYPELFRSKIALTADQRMGKLKAVKVVFDANGGACADGLRIVEWNASYGQSMNIYPSEDERYFNMYNIKMHLPSNVLLADVGNSKNDRLFLNYFNEHVTGLIGCGDQWTYVLDVANFEGAIAGWYVGQTWGTNNNDYACLTAGNFGRDIKTGDKKFLRLKGTPWKERNMLDRAFIVLDPWQHVKTEFRVSLFAGTGVNEANYHYVKPGETIACPLPVPTRDGYEFEGWYDGEKRVTEATKVKKREPHTLTARWRKRE